MIRLPRHCNPDFARRLAEHAGAPLNRHQCYSVLEGRQRIGRIRLVIEHMPASGSGMSGDLPMGSSQNLDTAKEEFKAAWEGLKGRTSPEQRAAAYKAMNIRDDG